MISLQFDFCFRIGIECSYYIHKGLAKTPFLQYQEKKGPGDRVKRLHEIQRKQESLLRGSLIPSRSQQGYYVNCSPDLIRACLPGIKPTWSLWV